MTTRQIYKLFTQFPRVETDSRNITQGCIFFALKGEKFNGNKFAAEALAKGASYAIIDQKKFHQSERTILVNNVLETLQQLALLHRKTLGIPILAITGSNGKTTTKELIAVVLSAKFNVSFTSGNFNNHIGVPLTLLAMNEKTEFGIVEMGANHPGEIGELCSIAQPDYGIITNIGRAHLEGFGSFEAIKNTKAELYKFLQNNNGTVFYNKNNPILSKLTQEIRNKVSYGENNANLTGKPVHSPPFVHAEVQFPHEKLVLATNLTGSFNFENVMAAACIGHYFNVAPFDIRTAINNYLPKNNRSQLIEKNELKIIMDAYNANPTSMQASIESFASAFPAPRFLILGDMFELGSQSQEEHAAILSQIKKHPFAGVFLAGPFFSEAAQNYPFHTFPDSGELCRYLAQNPITRGNILIKGSRGVQLEKVLEVL